jgi:hypothetical protein
VIAQEDLALEEGLAQENLRLSDYYGYGSGLQASQGWSPTVTGTSVQGGQGNGWVGITPGTYTGTYWNWGEPRDNVIQRTTDTREGSLRWHAYGGDWMGVMLLDDGSRSVYVVDVNGMEVVGGGTYRQAEYPTEIAELYEAIIAQQLEKPDEPTNP